MRTEYTIKNLRSSSTASNEPLLPSPSIIEHGEIAVNYAKGNEALAIKNSNNEIVALKFGKADQCEAKLKEEIELRTVDTNAMGFPRMVGAGYRYMARQGHGHIAVISSIAGTKGLGPAPSYSATKAFQNCYIQALEQQACSRGLDIRFTDVRPGFVDTALLHDGNRYPMLLSPTPVAREIVAAVESREHVRVIDWRWRIVTALWRRIPRCLWRRMKL